MKQQVVCAKCLQSVDRILAMECNHGLCLVCASRRIKGMHKGTSDSHSAKSRLSNLQCQICGVVSYLHPTAYEELLGVEPKKLPSRDASQRDLSHRPMDIPSERKPISKLDMSEGPPMLFCFSCETTCFSVDDYINGLHRNHEVGNTGRPETVTTLKQLLAEVAEQVRKRIEVALRQSTKLTQRKRQLIEQLGRSKTSIRGSFERLREELALKEAEMLTELDSWMAGKFNIVDAAIQDLKLFTEKCENTEDILRCYQQAIIQADVVKGFNYYADRKVTILQEISQPVEKQTDKAVSAATNLLVSFDSLSQVSQQLKNAKLAMRESQYVQPNDNYFETIRQQIFNQDTRKESAARPARQLNASLARVRSAANLVSSSSSLLQQKPTIRKPSRERESMQSRLQEKIRGLQSLLDRKSRQPTRLLRRNILNL